MSASGGIFINLLRIKIHFIKNRIIKKVSRCVTLVPFKRTFLFFRANKNTQVLNFMHSCVYIMYIFVRPKRTNINSIVRF